MSALALALVLFQVAAAAPTPAPTPTPTPRPVSAGPRTLQDVARELKLSGAKKGKGSLGVLSVGSSTASPAPKTTPGSSATPEATPEASPEATPESGASTASVRVSTVTNDGIVDGVGAVRVNGTVRNTGSRNACNVIIEIKLLDSRGLFLSSGQASPDVAVLPPGDVVSFHTLVQAPPGVRGARTNPDRKDTTEGSTTMGGDWKLLGGTEATVASASEDCGR